MIAPIIRRLTHRQRIVYFLAPAFLFSAALHHTALAEDWPTYKHDNRRSGVTGENLSLPLKQCWVYSAPTPPKTAWPGPAQWDAYATIDHLKSLRDFDPVFYVTAVGDSVYFGSSVDDSAHCLDARTGQTKWTYCTDAPVRLPPAWSAGRVYFGSDDGCAYCLDAHTGALQWKYKPADDDRIIPNDGKLISLWPCRTGVLVQSKKVYFAASLLPWNPSYLCALDAATGADTGNELYKTVLHKAVMQGPILASPTNLYLSQGRSTPMVCDRATGKQLGIFGQSGNGGVHALLTTDDTFIHGRGQNHGSYGELRAFNARTRDYIATFPTASAMVATDKLAYLHTRTELTAFDRLRYLELGKEKTRLTRRRDDIKEKLKKAVKNLESDEGKKLTAELKRINSAVAELNKKFPSCYFWRKPSEYPHAMILAGEVLFLGGKNGVAAISTADGKQLWKAPVTGTAFGLTAANARLYVSTDLGKIYCFSKS
jgi:outer membrane protein assembly factor BamB